MSTNVFDLYAKIGIDTADYEKGISKASGTFKNFATGFKDASAKVIGLFGEIGSAGIAGAKGYYRIFFNCNLISERKYSNEQCIDAAA